MPFFRPVYVYKYKIKVNLNILYQWAHKAKASAHFLTEMALKLDLYFHKTDTVAPKDRTVLKHQSHICAQNGYYIPGSAPNAYKYSFACTE